MACPPPPKVSLVPAAHADGTTEKGKEGTYQEERCVHYHPARTFCQRHTPGDGPAGWGTWPPRGESLQGCRWAHWKWRQDAGPSPPGRTLRGMDRTHTRAKGLPQNQAPHGQRDDIPDLDRNKPHLCMWLTLKLVPRDKIITTVTQDTCRTLIPLKTMVSPCNTHLRTNGTHRKNGREVMVN